MPLLTIETNVEPNDSAEVIAACSAAVAEMLGKPESYVMVALRHNPAMSFAGNTEPLAYLELKSLGLPETRTEAFSSILCQLIQEHFGIAPARSYIEFSSPPRHMWGWNSTTF